jgi:CHAT domain-containing protein/TolA-binding protein
LPNTKLWGDWNIILSWGVIFAFSLSAFGYPYVDSLTQGSTSAPFEEAALRAVVEKYVAACGKKDLAGVEALWSEKSPNLAAYKQRLQQQFTSEDLSFGSPAISGVKVDGVKASLRMAIALTSINLKSKQKNEQRLRDNFEFVKESGEWKVWRYAPAVNDLAGALVKAGNEAERAALLAEDKELVTAGLARALLIQGLPLFHQGSFKRALEIFRLAHEIAQQRGDKAITANALTFIGNVLLSQGNYTEALEQYRKSVKIREEINDQAKISEALIGVGNVHLALGNYTQALEDYHRCLKISEETRDTAGIARAMINIGNVHNSQGNYVKALEQYQRGLKISEELRDKAEIALTLNNIGLLYFRQGNYTQALEQYQKSLKIYEEIDNKVGIATTQGKIGIVHHAQGNYTQALEQYFENLKVSEKLNNKAEKALILNNIGHVHYLQANYTQALDEYYKSLKIREEIGAKSGIALTQNNIGEVHRLQGNYTPALQFASRAVDLANRIGNLNVLWQAHTTAGKTYFALNQFSFARQSYEEAIVTVEALRTQIAGGEQEQQRFFESKVSPYHAMVELLIAQNHPGEALSYAERAKARVLLGVLSSGRVNVTKTMTSQEIEQERKHNSRLVSLNTQIYQEKQRRQADQNQLNQLDSELQKARLDFEAFQTNLYAVHPELKTQRGEAAPLMPEQVGDLLPDATIALLEFVVSDEKTYLFVVTKSATVQVNVFLLEIKEKELTDRIVRFREMLSNTNPRFSKPAHGLYDLLLKPAAAHLKGKTRLLIVPDGPLWELPFQALQTPQDRYLIDDHSIFYAPSLSVVREMMNARRNKEVRPFAASSLLALGNPALGTQTITRVKAVLMDERLDPLPETERLVRTLGRIHRSGRNKIYVGAEAREERFKTEAKDYDILHLASHGILNDRSPMYSHLLLAQTGEAAITDEDGMLEAWELMNLDLRAELAVLSACETARGRVGKGEGMIGITWALFVAGVPRTVVSQWKVRSNSTAELMVEFHRQLVNRSRGSTKLNSAAEALRAAALKLKGDSRYRHPFYWAGFVIVGVGY